MRSNFKEIKLGELVEFMRNGLNAKQSDEKIGCPITRIETISDGKINIERVKYAQISDIDLEKYKLKEGDILFSHINSTEHIAKTAIYEGNPKVLVHGINLLLLRPKKERIYPKYLLYLLKNNDVRKYFSARCKKAVNQSSLNQQDIKSLKIKVSALSMQQKIVSILEKVETAKEKRKEANRLTEEFLKSVFLEMFGDPVRNPKGWDIKPLKEFLKIIKNNIEPSEIKSGMMYIGLEHIEKETGEILAPEIIIKVNIKSNKFIFTPDNLLLGKLRPYLNKVALPKHSGICSTDIFPLLPIEGKSNKYFLAYMLRHEKFVDYATKRSVGANLPRINTNAIYEFKTYLPPIELQQKFADIVQKVEKLKEKQKESERELDNLFNCLMQKAFKGEM